MKTIKIVIGAILLGFSAFYLLGLFISFGDMKDTVAYSADSYIQVEYKESEYMGEEVETEWGQELSADAGYGYYRLSFCIENLSSKAYYGVPAGAIRVEGEEYGEVRWDTEYEGSDSDYEKLFYEAGQPALPGKTSISAVLYVQVQNGVEQIYASYIPSWKEEESIEIPITLDKFPQKI